MATAGLSLIISTVCNATFCEPVYDNPQIDQTESKHKEELQKLAQGINGTHLKVATYINYPLSWVERQENGSLVGKGVAFQILAILQEKFNFTYEVVAPSTNYVIGGSRPEDSVIGLVNSSAVDMAVAFLPTINKFRRQVTFSAALDEGVWSMMLKRPTESATGSGLLAPFETNVWYLILAALLSYVPCITLLTKIRSRMVKDGEEHISLSPSFWFVYAAFIKQGTSLAPEANTTRLLFATWWIFIILLSSFYTANLTAFLTLSKFTLEIKTVEDLSKKNYRWVAEEGSVVQFMINDIAEDLSFLSRMISTGRGKFYNILDDKEFLPIVRNEAVLIKEQVAVDHLMYADYLRKTREGVDEGERCTYVVAPQAFMALPRAFAFPRDSKLPSVFNPAFTYLLQSGIINFQQVRDLPSTKMCPLDLQSKDRKLRNADLLMTYIIMGVGLSAAGVVFVSEILLRRYVRIKFKKDRDRPNKERNRKRSKKIRFRDQDNSRPPPYDSLFGLNSRYKNVDNLKRRMVNGREYYVVDTVSGDTRLIPVRTPSALLYQ